MACGDGRKWNSGLTPTPTNTLHWRVSPMARCRFCGAGTVLFDGDEPICVKCDDELEQRRKRENSRAPYAVLDSERTTAIANQKLKLRLCIR